MIMINEKRFRYFFYYCLYLKNLVLFQRKVFHLGGEKNIGKKDRFCVCVCVCVCSLGNILVQVGQSADKVSAVNKKKVSFFFIYLFIFFSYDEITNFF